MKIKVLWSAHRIKIITLAILLLGGGYYWYQQANTQNNTTQYLTATASKQTIVVSVAGTGQVAASSQIDIKPEVGGKILSLKVKNGDQVKIGQLIAQLDAADALRTVKDANTNLETAKLNLEKLQQPPDELALTTAENNLAQTKQSLTNAQINLDQDYTNANLTVAGTYLQLPTIINGLQKMFYNSTYESNQWNIDWYANRVLTWDNTVLTYKNDLTTAYNAAKTAYDITFTNFQALPSNPSSAQIESIQQETYSTTKLIAEAIKKATSYLDFIDNITVAHNSTSPQTMKNDQTSLRTYTSTINNQVSQLLSAINTLSSAKTAIITAQNNVNQSTLSLANLTAGADALDIRAQQITIEQRQNNLADAQNSLADYSVRSPIDGIITNVNSSLKPGQVVSTGSSLASVITTQSLAEITLNEIDVAKIKINQQATLTFDALSDVTLTGKVGEIAQIGTVSQGVVSYSVKIALDVEDSRVKPGMSVTANIITDSQSDVLAVPNSAVKTNAQGSYVEILTNGQPVQKAVLTGIANDTLIEITQGLDEGEAVITSTITNSASSSSSTTTGTGNAGFGGGGAIRVFTGGSGRPPGN